MKIDVNRAAISIGDKYSVFMNEKGLYRAAKTIFSLLAELSIYEDSAGDPFIVINQKFSFKPKYAINITGGEVLYFETVSLWKSQFQCVSGMDTYSICANRGRKWSIYKNDIQIAWWEESAVNWFNGDNYKIIADDDCKKELLVAFCLIIDNHFNDGKKSAVNFKLGNIAFGMKKFDPQWQPKTGKKIKQNVSVEEDLLQTP